MKNGFALAVIYADTKIGAGFHAGIAVDRNKSGVVTSMGKSRRVIKEINNRPAFEVYRDWAEGGLDDVNPTESTAIWSRSFALVRVYNLSAEVLRNIGTVKSCNLLDGTRSTVSVRVFPLSPWRNIEQYIG